MEQRQRILASRGTMHSVQLNLYAPLPAQVTTKCESDSAVTIKLECSVPESIGLGVSIVTVERISLEGPAAGSRVASDNHLPMYLLPPNQDEAIATSPGEHVHCASSRSAGICTQHIGCITRLRVFTFNCCDLLKNVLKRYFDGIIYLETYCLRLASISFCMLRYI